MNYEEKLKNESAKLTKEYALVLKERQPFTDAQLGVNADRLFV